MSSKNAAKEAGSRVIVSFLIAIVIFFILTSGVKFVFGLEHPFMVVVGNSMYPTLKDGDLIVVKKVNPNELSVGDIIVYESPLDPESRIVHRIIEIVSYNPPAFRVKGDNRDTPDPWIVTSDMIIGKVIYSVPKIGIIPRFLSPILKPPINYLIIIFVVFVIFAWEFYKELSRREEEVVT